MSYEFKGKFGVSKPHTHELEKFLLFVVVGGQEVPLYEMLKQGLVEEQFTALGKYITYNNVVKVFSSYADEHGRRKFYSFYIALQEPPGPIITIKPFSALYYLNGRARVSFHSDFRFEGCGKFLSNKEAFALLPEGSTSRKFVARQGILPLDELKRLVTINRSAMMQGVRHIRMGRKEVGVNAE